MRNLIYVASIVVIIVLASCGMSSKDSYIKQFNSFLENIEKKESLSEKELEKASARFEEFTTTYYDKFKDELSNDDLKKVGELKARYLKVVAKQHLKEIDSSLEKAGKEIEGFLDGLGK